MTLRPLQPALALAAMAAACFELPPDPRSTGFVFRDTHTSTGSDGDAADQDTAAVEVSPDADEECVDGQRCAWGCVRGGTCSVAVPPVGGGRASCVGTLDGLWCWGDQRVASLPGDVAPAPTPPTVVSLTNERPGSEVVGLALGERHACLAETGRVACWGANDRYQVSVAGDDVITTPTLVPIEDVRTIAARADWTCATRDDGGVWCWGRSRAGVFDATAPTRLDGFLDVTELAVGDDHVCGLTSTRQVLCWGDNTDGQVGVDPAVSPRLTRAEAVADGVQHVIVGARHTCAHRGYGLTPLDPPQLVCWGDGARGQTGPGADSESPHVPVDVTRALPDERMAQVSAGDTFTCALLASGALHCWGDDEHGQRLSPTRADSAAPTRLDLPPLEQIGAGPRHVCGVDRERVIRCWGDGRFGQLGDARYAAPVTLEPVVVSLAPPPAGCDLALDTLPPGAIHPDVVCELCGEDGAWEACPLPCDPHYFTCTPAREVGVGAGHACARDQGGRVACWGDNTDGQVGTTPIGPGRAPLGPSVVRDTGQASQLAVGRDHTCVVSHTPEDGARVRCWGSNEHHQVAPSDAAVITTPTAVELGAGPPERIDAGPGDVTCALMTDGRVLCWGLSDDGALGAAEPTEVAELAGRTVTDLRVGVRHACALVDHGASIHCWGASSPAAQLCWNDFVARDPNPPGTGLFPIKAMDVGADRTCVASDGWPGVWCCGDNTAGAAGYPIDNRIVGAAFEPTEIAAVGLALGETTSCAWTAEGQVSCWGSNATGLLGGHDLGDAPAPARIGSVAASMFVSVGVGVACSVDPGGAFVRCWGDDSAGALGRGARGDAVVPWAEVVRQFPR